MSIDSRTVTINLKAKTEKRVTKQIPYDQCLELLEMDGPDDVESTYKSIIEKEIKRKKLGYDQQDKRKDRYFEENIKPEEIRRKLLDQRLCCYYCKEKMVMNGQSMDKRQWTLDRIENHVGHTEKNVVASCLECNLRKRRRDSEKFKYGKQLQMIKKIV